MEDSILRLVDFDEAIWEGADIPPPNKLDYWLALADSQIGEIVASAGTEHEDAEWADLFLVALHRLRSSHRDHWSKIVYRRLQNHAHKGINVIKEKYGTPAR